MPSQLIQFRSTLYESLPYRADALLNLMDALASNAFARSVVELSLSLFFRREYSSVFDAIDNFFPASRPETRGQERRATEQMLVRSIAPYLLAPQAQKFWLLGLDVISIPRLFAETLADRTFVYQPNSLKGNKPVTIGHQASVVAHLPERSEQAPPWLVPLVISRVASDQTSTAVGAAQVQALLSDESLAFAQALCVLVGDGAYGVAPFLGRMADLDNLVTVSRVAANRVFYRPPDPLPPGAKRPRGHPRWYGEPFRLKDPSTWGEPDETLVTTYTSRNGRTYTLQLQGWYDLLMRGKKDLAMHRYSFTLVQAILLDAQGKPAFQRPLWLIVQGRRRRQLCLQDAWDSYDQRSDLEHFFRFGKQKLLLAAFIGTPNILQCDGTRSLGHGLMEATCGKIVHSCPPRWGCSPKNCTLSPGHIRLPDRATRSEGQPAQGHHLRCKSLHGVGQAGGRGWG